MATAKRKTAMTMKRQKGPAPIKAKRVASRQPATVKAFDAGKIGRRLRAIPVSRIAINTQIRRYGKNVVARSRYLCAENPYASSAKEEFVAYVVGTGITPAWQIKDKKLKAAIQEAFAAWCDECDADWITDFYGQQSIVGAEVFEAGEIFIRLRPRRPEDGLTVPLQLQLLPSEMLPTEDNRQLANGARVECGIQFSPIGKREGYWFFNQHPGETNVLSARYGQTFVPADEVIHIYRPIRAGQIRGIPHTLSGMVTLAMLDLYDDAELERKRLAALFGAFITKGLNQPDDTDSSPLQGAPTSAHDTSSDQLDIAMEPGATVELDWGQDVKFAEPADVGGNYEAFQKRQLLRASAGFGSTYHGMTGDTGGANFSSMRADQLRLKRRIEPIQWHMMIHQMCRQVANAWMDAAVLAGAVEGLTATKYMAEKAALRKVKWSPQAWDWVDPVKDITAEKLAVDSGFKSRQSVVAGRGEDIEDVDDQIAQDQERAKEKGIKFMQLGATVVVSPTGEEDKTPAPQDPNNPPQPGKRPPKQQPQE